MGDSAFLAYAANSRADALEDENDQLRARIRALEAQTNELKERLAKIEAKKAALAAPKPATA